MLFNSIEFLIFLPIVFLLYWLLFKSLKSRNIFIIVASYIFYGWWSPMFLLLIFITSVSSFFSGLLVDTSSHRSVRRTALWGSVVLNLGILGLYKYFNFFSQAFAMTMAKVGWQVDAVTLDLILPVGISFYTFQALSYVIDVNRRKISATRDFFAFMAFISFFPQLVAGPIERATNLLPQFLKNRKFDYSAGVSGMRLILWGLFKKMVVADNCASMVDFIFDSYTTVGSLNLWIGAFLFTFQIYCDFSGYSDIARGVARLFGVELMHNFRLPYFSKNIKEFWQRWHISLTSWFRDYVYIPLGGNRNGKLKKIRNFVIVFLTSGLWHGANFTFIVWGAYHVVLHLPYLIMEDRGKIAGKNSEEMNGNKRKGPRYIKSVLAMGTTFILVMIGWIMFRAPHLREAFEYIKLMFASVPADQIKGKRDIAWCILLVMAEWLGRKYESPVDLFSRGIGRFEGVRWGCYLILLLVIFIFSGSTEQFIYFQF